MASGSPVRPWGVAAVLLLLAATAQGTRLAPHGAAPAPPSGLAATAYVVDLTVGDSQSFDVSTVVTILAEQAADVIVVNAKQLDVAAKVTVRGKNKNGLPVMIPVTEVDVDGDRQEVAIHLGEKLLVGVAYNVTITATGTFGNPSDDGLVKATFGSHQNSWLAAIRTSPTSARMVFPCVDEAPGVADVTLRVWRPASHAAISNAPVASTESIGGGRTARDTFEKVRLAPHQVALVVAPLAQRGLDGTTVALWGRQEADDALEDVLQYVSTVDGLAQSLSGLPLAHLSVVALPGVSAAAATVGIAAMSEEAVLSLHPAAPTSAHRDALLQLAEAVAQPAVRGATRPADWLDAWSLGGLAAHLKHRFANQAAAGWRLAEQQAALQLQGVLEDAAKWTDAPLISANGSSNAAKGAALIRMLEYAINPKVFDNAALRFYSLSAGKAVSVDDLYDAFSLEAYNGDSWLSDGVTVVNILQSWASKAGYPVVTVIRDYENNAMTVSQKIFSWSSIYGVAKNDAASERWVPLSYTYALERKNDGDRLLYPKEWLVPGENDMEITIHHLSSDDWVYFNLDQAAPYRVNYDTTNWRLLSRELLSVQFDKTLPPASRAHILGDALALARAGELDYALALDLTAYLRQEDDLLPWLVARRSLAFLEDRLQGYALDWLRQFEALLLKTVYLDSQYSMGGGPDAQSPDVRLLRELATTWACEAGLQQCLDHVDQLYSDWRSGGQAPHPDVVEAVLCRAVATHGDSALSFVLDALADDTLVGGQRRSYVRAASCGATEDLLRRAVSEALSSSGPFMATEVADLLEAACSRKPHGWAIVQTLLEKDFARVQERTGNEGELRTLARLLASKATSVSQLYQVRHAVAAWPGPEDEAFVNGLLHDGYDNVAWTGLKEDEVADWIRVYLDLPPPSPTTPATAPTAPTRPTASPATPTTPSPSGAEVPCAALWTISLLAAAAAAGH